MTNREAALKSCKDRLEHLENTPPHHCGKRQRQRAIELEKVKIEALRPITREQVEKVWRGEWNDINPKVLKPNVSWICRCIKCGCPQDYKHNFCPNCGAAQTDKAVDMVMERVEALYE